MVKEVWLLVSLKVLHKFDLLEAFLQESKVVQKMRTYIIGKMGKCEARQQKWRGKIRISDHYYTGSCESI